jgi:hypothetical protein
MEIISVVGMEKGVSGSFIRSNSEILFPGNYSNFSLYKNHYAAVPFGL